ncbi:MULTISPECIES: manganese catalase family protein [Thermoanaerobacterium]|uniref:Manganese containing catalase n=1 Tax=Thermoanaerobacterium xylanolyticum (strain ATCC 49914 / DSM 7097 / LX-11) TaxID=858215 RepID=F6BIX6_THEXL|nr:manganese catalase family protein [Thermoanaerobacterium xylanolyticum]AEF17861.1 manganese containing catalase [Thermoanaerobacterium xylanolyticum LX-11]
MWVYEKKLEYPANVCKPDIKMAKFLIAQYGGPDGELAAALRYQTQRYTMPTGQAKGTLTDISTEEFGHLEIIATLVFKLLKGVPVEELRREGLGEQYTEHDRALFYSDTTGMLWTAAYIQAKGDVIADLHEDMAAEEKARATYEHLINLTDDPCVKDTLRFLREREIVHFQRFGETLDLVQEHLRSKKIF